MYSCHTRMMNTDRCSTVHTFADDVLISRPSRYHSTANAQNWTVVTQTPSNLKYTIHVQVFDKGLKTRAVHTVGETPRRCIRSFDYFPDIRPFTLQNNTQADTEAGECETRDVCPTLIVFFTTLESSGAK